MALKKFNPESCPKGTYSKVVEGSAKISVDNRGVFMLSKPVQRLLALAAGARLEIAQDPDATDNFYLVKSQTGFALKQVSKGKTDLLTFTSASLRKTLLQGIHPLDTGYNKTFYLLVGASSEIDGETCWPLLTWPLNK